MENTTNRQIVENLAEKLKKDDRVVEIDEPLVDSGSWFIDVYTPDQVWVIGYKKGKGFGLSTPPFIFEEGHDIVLESAEEIIKYIEKGLTTK